MELCREAPAIFCKGSREAARSRQSRHYVRLPKNRTTDTSVIFSSTPSRQPTPYIPQVAGKGLLRKTFNHIPCKNCPELYIRDDSALERKERLPLSCARAPPVLTSLWTTCARNLRGFVSCVLALVACLLQRCKGDRNGLDVRVLLGPFLSLL